MPRTYSPSSYDDNFCLKPPALLWLAVLYLSRAFVLLVIYDLSSLSGVSPETVAMLHGAVSIYALVPALVAAPVLYAFLRRAPSSAKLVRWFWSHGRTILILAAILDCQVSIGASGMIGGDVANLNAGALLAALFDIYFLVYILATRRVRDAFADFPPPAPARRRRA
ncbi:MAG TPA: DUF2919 family protein [Steroidobacteraceae bacterium]|nr:DUF2919 family protein [Steroidobacteraceae bacterium]